MCVRVLEIVSIRSKYPCVSGEQMYDLLKNSTHDFIYFYTHVQLLELVTIIMTITLTNRRRGAHIITQTCDDSNKIGT